MMPGALAAVVGLGMLLGLASLPAAASANAASDRKEQLRYATETMKLHYRQFVTRANDFRNHGCKNKWPETPGDPPTSQGCRKPSPYNKFDWTTDGCSGTPPPALMVFNRPCQQHDFGYRNFGKGLTLRRTEDQRNRIDDHFRDEMYRICRDPRAALPLGGYPQCIEVATAMYGVVRNHPGNDWSKPGPNPAPGPSPTPAPPPAPAQHVFHVHNTCADNSCGLLVETAPGSGFGGRVIGTLNDGDAANIRCQTVGGMVSGGEGMNDVWDQIDYAGGVAYVSDLYMDTPGDNTPQPHRHFTNSIPRC